MSENTSVALYQGRKMTKEEVALIKEHIAKGASDAELKIFLAICEKTGLDPFSRQIHLVPRWDSKQRKEVRTAQVGIDGFRAVAERSGKYAGSQEPEYGDEVDKSYTPKEGSSKAETYKVPSVARVTVKKVVDGILCDFTSSARWEEYYPGDLQGFMWRKKPYLMLAKCAEAQALRKAFPMMLSGFYIPEEMEASDATVTDDDNQESDFMKAATLLGQMKDLKNLQDFINKIKASKKYTAKQKAELNKILKNRIEEVKTGVPVPPDDVVPEEGQ